MYYDYQLSQALAGPCRVFWGGVGFGALGLLPGKE